MPTPAVILLSGGLDSAVTLALARESGHVCHALSIDYAQRHRAELDAARAIARAMGVRHTTVTLDLRAIGGSALTADIDVPKDQPQDRTGIPITYVPARNLTFLSLAAGLAEVIGARDIYIGVNAVDYSGYPDCRPEFIRSFEATANLATKAGVEGRHFRIHTPLITLPKHEIIRQGARLNVDFSLTRSCYDPDESGRACARCDACHIRANGFTAAGIPDPTIYTPEVSRT